MKKLAARDFEDLLQCSIPAFEGLFPEPHNSRILRLLYRLCEWHALAKLRMHTDSSLNHLDSLTKELGALTREFRDKTCQSFETKELPREAAARQRRAQQKKTQPHSSRRETSSARRLKTLNLKTYKYHALDDYVRTIRVFGCTDNYSTQLVCHSLNPLATALVIFFIRANMHIALSSGSIVSAIKGVLINRLLLRSPVNATSRQKKPHIHISRPRYNPISLVPTQRYAPLIITTWEVTADIGYCCLLLNRSMQTTPLPRLVDSLYVPMILGLLTFA